MGHRFMGFEIPDYMEEGIRLYVERGIKPGGFLQAIICNDLRQAVANADSTNMQNIPAYVDYFYNHTPSVCWGSEENMKEWIERKNR